MGKKVRIAYLILAHYNIENIINLYQKLTLDDLDCEVFIHFDKNSAYDQFEELYSFCSRVSRCHILEKRIGCAWGEFSLVDATLELLKEAREKSQFTHFFLLSGSCCPVHNLTSLKIFLKQYPCSSFIEVESSNWILAGMRDDRYRYHHMINYRKYPILFKKMYQLQKLMRVERILPQGISEIKFGSQWWCLHYQSVNKIFEYLHEYPGIIRFFKSVWIPDECFFQTVLWHADKTSIISKNLTYYEFDEHGKPLVFNTVKDIEVAKLKEKFFARKVNRCI